MNIPLSSLITIDHILYQNRIKKGCNHIVNRASIGFHTPLKKERKKKLPTSMPQ